MTDHGFRFDHLVAREDPLLDIGVPGSEAAGGLEVVGLEDQDTAARLARFVDQGPGIRHPTGLAQRADVVEVGLAVKLPKRESLGTVASDHAEEGHLGILSIALAHAQG